jgi:4-amino-4-deoxy-L-arabinose transferase-like glycosyltransferase
LHPSTLAKRLQFFISIVFLAFYFFGLGHLPLVGPDEPRYAQVAREMFLRGDWISPTLGGHTWFEKPALLYWLIIPAYKAFGVHEWTARLGPALCGVFTLAGIWWLAREIERTSKNRSLSEWSLLLTSSCLGLIVFSRGVSFDIVVTATLTWAFCFFLRSQLTAESSKQNQLLFGFYVLVGLSLLAKGLVGIVVPAGVITLYFLMRREWPARKLWLSLIWGVPVSLVVSAVWYGPVIYRHGWQFIDEFFVQHHFARYLSNKYHHPQPFYFYPVILLMLTVPWTPFLIQALLLIKKWNWRGDDAAARSRIFLMSWILFPIVFFSFSGSKLPGYILPVLPPALLLLSTSITERESENHSRWTWITLGVVCMTMGVAGAVYGIRVEHLSIVCLLFSSLPFTAAGLFAVVWNRNPSYLLLTIAGTLLLALVIILNCAAGIVSARESTRDLLALADARGYTNLPVLAMHGDDRSAQFYATGRVMYGNDGEVISLDEAPAIVDSVRKRNERILAFIPAENTNLFRGKPGIEVIGSNGKLALLCLY